MRETWTMKDGREINICDMETSHIENCIKMLERNAEEGVEYSINLGYDGDDDFQTYDEGVMYGKEYLKTTQYNELKKELKKRKITCQ